MNILVILVVFIGLFQLAQSDTSFTPAISSFSVFENAFGKVYKNLGERVKAILYFSKTLVKILANNLLFNRNEVSYQLKINRFADLSDADTEKFTTGNIPEPPNLRDNFLHARNFDELTPDMVVTGPATKDWRTGNHVTAVKDQGFTCGSCYAFSAIAALETAFSIKYGNLTALSEQFLIDCIRNDLTGNWGCNGGSPGAAYLGIEYAPGVPPQSVYPYEEKENACRFNSQTSVGTTKGYVKITLQNETFMRDIVGTIGPVAASMNSKTTSFLYYGSGVIDDPDCVPGTSHSVAIIGYGTARYKSGKVLDYWICKNSWSTDWGENGYFRIARGKDMCGISRTINLPLV